MGTGEADGDTRAIDAAEKAIANPLLDEVSLKGAQGVLINITGGYDLTLFEMDEAANRIKDEVDANAMIKFGSAIDPEMEGRMRVSVVATGIDAESAVQRQPLSGMPRKRPAATDPGMISAVRGAVRRPEAATAQAEVAEPVREHAPAAAPVARRVVREPEPAPEPMAQPSEVETRAATTPGPDDIRARAEEVRKRAMAARAQRDTDAARPTRVIDDEPELFDVDRGSIDHAPVDHARARAEPEPSTRPLAAERRAPSERTSVAGRGTGLFAINKLIHRVSGAGQSSEPDHPDRGPVADDDDGEIPAFLRRQAN